jgi:mannose-6-phosphate isomerase-like protein (cupin superfamily)
LPFKLLDRPEVEDIFAKWASQSAKSLLLMIAGAYKLDNEPATILYMQPIKDDVPKVLRVKINPILKCIKDLWQKFEDYTATEGIRTKDAIKQLAGGAWVVSGSSVKERKSLSIMMLLLDEMGEFDSGATEEASERLKETNSQLHNIHLTGHRPWGTYTVLEEANGYKIKRIEVKPGKRLSLQKHFHRNEHWIVVSGTATVTVGDETRYVRPNESTYIKMGELHRLENEGKIPVVLIEAQVGEYTGEDDIVRIDDDFKRD